MNFIKNAWSKVTGFFQWIGVANKAQTLVKTFPGINDQEKLRSWVITNADSFQPVVDKTPNKIDDRVLDTVKYIALNERAWNASFNLMMIAYEMFPAKEPVYGAGIVADWRNGSNNFTDLLNGDEPVENPVLVISAVAIILQVIMFIRSQKKQ